MKRKIYLTHLFYIVGGVIAILIPLIFNIILIYAIIATPENPTIQYVYIMLFIGIIGLIIFINIIGRKMLQWIIIDESKITAKCIFGKIKEIEWSELKEIVFERYDVSTAGTKSGWFVFVENGGEELYQRNGLITKKSNITLKYNKSTLETINHYWKKEIKNLLN